MVGGDHQHRRFGGALLQLGDQVDSRGVGKPHVEHDGGRRGLGGHLEALGAGGSGDDAEAALFQVHGEQLANAPVVVDDQDSIHSAEHYNGK